MKCFYHKSDLDGHCSGAIIKLKYPSCEMIGVDYNDTLEKLGISFKQNEKVFIVDFSFEPDEMKTLQSKMDLVWIDHHKTAIEKIGMGWIRGIRDINHSGCELTWRYLEGKTPIPMAVFLLGRYDVWDFTNKNTLAFQYGMRFQENTLPSNYELWNSIFYQPEITREITEIGNVILKYEEQQNKKIAKGMCFEKEFHGYRAIIINKPYSNSKIFDSVYDPEKHDIMIIFGIKNGEFKYTLYCAKPEIDVSEIAKKYEYNGRLGGGHRGAAGFYYDKLLF